MREISKMLQLLKTAKTSIGDEKFQNEFTNTCKTGLSTENSQLHSTKHNQCAFYGQE